MFLIKLPNRTINRAKCIPTYTIYKEKCVRFNSSVLSKSEKQQINEDDLEVVINKYDSKLLFNSTIQRKRINLGFKKNNLYMAKMMKYHEKLKYEYACIQPLPLSLKYFTNPEASKETDVIKVESESNEQELVNFPYTINTSDNIINENEIICKETTSMESDDIGVEIRQRHEAYKNAGDWMTAYDNFENDLDIDDNSDEGVNYGTPDPNSHISNVPCGGCGALLHCKDTGIPGYIPSEIYKNCFKKDGVDLKVLVCQRCFFLKEHNLALQIHVSPDEYPKILSSIRGKRALVVLMVDLLDFPCSIWPGIADILGSRTPIIVAGNKVDLLPKDGRYFLDRIKKNLLNQIKVCGFAMSNILHVELISAKNGYGIEDLISALHHHWKYKGDVYLVGCTNVGKSSLFNTLLQSDFCKIQASDLIQRATISQWPGTTLNMLKFPIMRPSGSRLYLRHQRLQKLEQIKAQEKKLKSELLSENNSPKYATLIGHIGQTFIKANSDSNELKDRFATANVNAIKNKQIGIDDKAPEYAASRWCFDTPGVIQPDQILHLLTIEELMVTIPKILIRPETFCVKPKTSLFIAGLARLDFLEGPESVRLTVFRSNGLPITICPLEEADDVYKDCLGTELFKVPMSGEERLSKWPGLESQKAFNVTSEDSKTSCSDVVLSSAGWVAINCSAGSIYKFQAWTPEKRGIFVRDSILPNAVKLKGRRIRDSVAYGRHKFI